MNYKITNSSLGFWKPINYWSFSDSLEEISGLNTMPDRIFTVIKQAVALE